MKIPMTIEINTEETLEKLRDHLDNSQTSIRHKQAIVSLAEMLAITKQKMTMRQIEAWAFKNSFPKDKIRTAKAWLFYREYITAIFQEDGAEGKLLYSWNTARLL